MKNALLTFWNIAYFFSSWYSHSLIQELNVCLKSSVKAISLAGKYINNPYENRNASSQWISSIFHEHSKAYFCMNDELGFMVSILLSQAMMQLGVSEGFLFPND